MFSLAFQEKIRKPLIGLAGIFHSIGIAGSWLHFVSATHRFIIWRSPFIKSLNAGCIIDIGANSGEFALLARAVFPSAKIVSFEPQADAFATLNKVMRKDPHFQSYQVALGETEGTAIMHIADFSPSSSFMVASAGSVPQEIAIRQLDTFEDLIETNHCTIVKMDVEGYELAILKGGKKFIGKTDYIYIECRTTELIGCSFSEIYDFLIGLGWEYRGAYDSVFSGNGKLQYFDALFYNLKKQVS
jgi:FkbM family methyltransferase